MAEVFPQNGSQTRFHFLNARPCAKEHVSALLSCLEDWEEVPTGDIALVLHNLASRHWGLQAESFSLALLDGVEGELAVRAIQEIEELLAARVSSDDLLHRLLIAPLRESSRAKEIAKLSVSSGFAVTGEVFNSLENLQPLLSRLALAWLKLPEELFAGTEIGRTAVWKKLFTGHIATHLLRASSGPEFKSHWTSLLSQSQSPRIRAALMKIGNVLTEGLYPAEEREPLSTLRDGPSDDVNWRQVPREPGVVRFERALRQVNAIAGAVSQGKDDLAYKFLKDLIQAQLEDGDTGYVTKSLCNIAQRCAEMFRTDFERECLLAARELNPGDWWTLVQWGDHLKRTGQFDSATEALERAWQISQNPIAKSCLADVWVRRGQFDVAIKIYQSLPGWDNDQRIRTALADILRRMGRLEDAREEYAAISSQWGGHRPLAGLAEIAKLQMRPKDALAIYDQILASPLIEISRLNCRMARIYVLKLLGRFEEAFQECDDIVLKFPFLMKARVLRASILGLLGQATNGLADVPQLQSSNVLGQWTANYFRGLLLLKLNRFKEARECLVGALRVSLETGDELVMLRLGAALALIGDENFLEASKILKNIPETGNLVARYLARVLMFHVATSEVDRASLRWVEGEIGDTGTAGTQVKVAVNHLRNGEMMKAIQVETELFLSATPIGEYSASQEESSLVF